MRQARYGCLIVVAMVAWLFAGYLAAMLVMGIAGIVSWLFGPEAGEGAGLLLLIPAIIAGFAVGGVGMFVTLRRLRARYNP